MQHGHIHGPETVYRNCSYDEHTIATAESEG